MTVGVSNWNKLRELYQQPPVGMTRQVILKRVWAEGDEMQKRIEELEIINIELAIRYGSLIKKNIDTEQKLEAIRPFIMECKDVMVKEAILEVLGDE